MKKKTLFNVNKEKHYVEVCCNIENFNTAFQYSLVKFHEEKNRVIKWIACMLQDVLI